MLPDHSTVHDVEIKRNGETYRASYYVEYEMIHARILGKIVSVPLSHASPADTVRGLLSARIETVSRRARTTEKWVEALSPSDK